MLCNLPFTLVLRCECCPLDEDGDGQPSFWDLVEEIGVVVTIPTFLIVVLQGIVGSAPWYAPQPRMSPLQSLCITV